MEFPLSRYGQASTVPSPVNRLMAEFAHGFRDGIDINLGVGFVNEQTIPVSAIISSLAAVAQDTVHHRQAFNYGSAAGSANLIGSLRRFLVEQHVGQLDSATVARQRIAIPASGATSALDALTGILAPGIVITSDPLYYIYAEVLERKGFEILAVPEDEDGISLEALSEKLAALGDARSRIAFLYVVTVNNPSCTILSNQRRRDLLSVASRLSLELGRAVPVFYDLAYELLNHDPTLEPFRSVLPDDALGIAFEIGTLSKVLAPSLRIGYVIGPDSSLMAALVQKTSDTGFSAPLFVQEMAAHLLDHHIVAQLQAVNAGYREKAVVVRAAIDRLLGPYLEHARGGRAGFYFYLTLRNVETGPESEFFRRLAEPSGARPRVIYIPGEYCVHSSGGLAELGRRQLRISYGFEATPRIVAALEIMAAELAVVTQAKRKTAML